MSSSQLAPFVQFNVPMTLVHMLTLSEYHTHSHYWAKLPKLNVLRIRIPPCIAAVINFNLQYGRQDEKYLGIWIRLHVFELLELEYPRSYKFSHRISPGSHRFYAFIIPHKPMEELLSGNNKPVFQYYWKWNTGVTYGWTYLRINSPIKYVVIFLSTNSTNYTVAFPTEEGIPPLMGNLIFKIRGDASDVFRQNIVPPQTVWCAEIDSIFQDDADGSNFVGTYLARNPFTLRMEYNRYIMAEIMKSINATLVHSLSFEPTTLPRIMWNVQKSDWTVYTDRSIFMTHAEKYGFISCHSTPIFSLHFYLQPFNAHVWYAILASTGIIIVATINFTKFYANLSNLAPLVNFEWLFLCSTLFGGSPWVPGRIKENPANFIVIYVWIMLVIVFTTGYTGLVITALNSSPGEEHLTKFSQLVCPPTNATDMEVMTSNPKLLPSGTSAFNSRNIEIADYYKCFSLLSKMQSEWGNYAKRPLSYRFTKILLSEQMLTTPSHAIVSNQFLEKAVEDELVKCGKSVYVGSETDIAANYNYFQKRFPAIDFYLGVEKLFPDSFGWVLQTPRGTKAAKKMGQLVENGILEMLRVLAPSVLSDDRKLRLRESQGINATEKFEWKIFVKPLNLRGNENAT
ncbi:hypothetical protein Fcan01_27332 [Folsomia candida]|uniref:Uncharacterized protein n=1 Tax=Folsomia candida TaxID=158441 RepID=A0A226CZ67_FOLCA|nr:hypothetical protein Fcan01_27332 [Folsomia candida]